MKKIVHTLLTKQQLVQEANGLLRETQQQQLQQICQTLTTCQDAGCNIDGLTKTFQQFNAQLNPQGGQQPKLLTQQQLGQLGQDASDLLRKTQQQLQATAATLYNLYRYLQECEDDPTDTYNELIERYKAIIGGDQNLLAKDPNLLPCFKRDVNQLYAKTKSDKKNILQNTLKTMRDMLNITAGLLTNKADQTTHSKLDGLLVHFEANPAATTADNVQLIKNSIDIFYKQLQQKSNNKRVTE